MARNERFTFLIDKDERRMITELAQRLRRTESDAVRFVVIEAAQALEPKAQLADKTLQAVPHAQ